MLSERAQHIPVILPTSAQPATAVAGWVSPDSTPELFTNEQNSEMGTTAVGR